MNTIGNIIKKDFRHCRWLLLAMVVVWLVKANLMLQISEPPSPEKPTQPIFFQPVALNGPNLSHMILRGYQLGRLPTVALFPLLVVYFSDIFLLIGITLRVFREDSALMELSFWRTRPISRGQMLAAKAIFVGLIAFPVQCLIQGLVGKLIFAQANIHYFSGSLSALWWGGLRDMVLIQACWTATAVVMATLWRSRVVGVGTLMLSALTVILLETEIQSSRGYPQQDVTYFLLLYTGLVGAALIAAYMYLKADRALGFSLYGTMLAIILIIVMFQ